MDIFISMVRSGYTVFSYTDLAQYVPHSGQQNLINKVNYYRKKWYLRRIRKGLYALSGRCDPFELGNKILKPSYISLQSALRTHGIVFQHEESVYLISYKTTEIEADGIRFAYRFLKKEIRENPFWVEQRKTYSIAGPERAVLDTLYLFKSYFFDNLDGIDWEKAEQMLAVYDSKALNERFNSLKKTYERDNTV